MRIRVTRIAAALVVAATLQILPAGAQTEGNQTMTDAASTEDRNRALTEAGFAAWSAGTGSPYDLLAEDATWTIVGRSDASKTYNGKAAFIDDVIRPFNARMSQGLKPTVRNIYTEGDAVIIFFDAAGVASNGQPYTNTYAWFWEMKDGRVVKAHAFFDSIAFNELWRGVEPAK